MKCDAGSIFVRESDGEIRVWRNDGSEVHRPGRRWFFAAQVKVLLDGADAGSVIACDIDEGWVERYRIDERGRPIIKRSQIHAVEPGAESVGVDIEIETERVCGRVELVFPGPPL